MKVNPFYSKYKNAHVHKTNPAGSNGKKTDSFAKVFFIFEGHTFASFLFLYYTSILRHTVCGEMGMHDVREMFLSALLGGTVVSHGALDFDPV